MRKFTAAKLRLYLAMAVCGPCLVFSLRSSTPYYPAGARLALAFGFVFLCLPLALRTYFFGSATVAYEDT
jgi:hypothetical protein